MNDHNNTPSALFTDLNQEDTPDKFGASPENSQTPHLSTGDKDADAELNLETDNTASQTRTRRNRVQRSFPAVPFEEALELPLAVQRLASGHRVRRLRLFELLGRSPDSSTSRTLITNSTRYSLTTGSYAAEWIELTPEGKIVTADDVPEREKIRTRFKLAIDDIVPFKKLHEHFVNNRLPAKTIMSDFLRDEGFNPDEVSECVDTFLLNARFVGVLQTLSGAERLLTLEHVLDYAPSGVQSATLPLPQAPLSAREPTEANRNANESRETTSSDANNAWDTVCFYITPIGEDGSESRMHADLFFGSIIEPALEEFGLKVVRADRIAEAGMISRQIIEHIMQARLVIADLSFHNPNVFYELALRHASGLPTVQIMRASDKLPFDVSQVRTIVIDTSSVYTLVPQLDVYRAAITSQVRRALESPEEVDNPVTPFYPLFKSHTS